MTEDAPEMRASDREREHVAEVLRDALAEGRLGVEEFQERLDSAYRARTRGQLLPLVRDLPRAAHGSGGHGADGTGSATAPAVRQAGWAERIGGRGTSHWGLSLLGGFGRKGIWTVPRAFTGVAVLGGGDIDLREARFEAREVVIRCFVLMGGISVLVPPEVELEVRGIGIMGGFDSSAGGAGRPEAPRVVVTGLAVWGGVGVERKITRAEKKRLREERRALREQAREERRRRQADRPHHGHRTKGGLRKGGSAPVDSSDLPGELPGGASSE